MGERVSNPPRPNRQVITPVNPYLSTATHDEGGPVGSRMIGCSVESEPRRQAVPYVWNPRSRSTTTTSSGSVTRRRQPHHYI
jgi:hypothetical protein